MTIDVEFAAMSAASFDTHSSVKTLTAAGMPESQAEAVTALLKLARDVDLGTLATAADLAHVNADLQREIAQVKADLQREIAQVKADLQREIAQVKADLQRDLAETKADILKWLVGMIAGGVVINAMSVIGAMLALVRMVAH